MSLVFVVEWFQFLYAYFWCSWRRTSKQIIFDFDFFIFRLIDLFRSLLSGSASSVRWVGSCTSPTSRAWPSTETWWRPDDLTASSTLPTEPSTRSALKKDTRIGIKNLGYCFLGSLLTLIHCNTSPRLCRFDKNIWVIKERHNIKWHCVPYWNSTAHLCYKIVGNHDVIKYEKRK